MAARGEVVKVFLSDLVTGHKFIVTWWRQSVRSSEPRITGPRARGIGDKIGGVGWKSEELFVLIQSCSGELQAVHQYMYFDFQVDDQGFTPLDDVLEPRSRRRGTWSCSPSGSFLQGNVKMVAAGRSRRSPSRRPYLVKAWRWKRTGSGLEKQAALECGANADSTSTQIFEGLVRDEEGHFDQYEKQYDNVKRFGLSYLALQSFDAAPPAGAAAE